MRRPRIRFTMRRMMIAVAVVAVATSILVKPYLDRARMGRIAAFHHREAVAYMAKAEAVGANHPDYEKLMEAGGRHESIAAKYARSATYGLPAPVMPPAPR